MTATSTAATSARVPETCTQPSALDLGLDSTVPLKKQRKLSETGTSRIFPELHGEPTSSESEHLYALEIIVIGLGKGFSTLRLPETASPQSFQRRIS